MKKKLKTVCTFVIFNFLWPSFVLAQNAITKKEAILYLQHAKERSGTDSVEALKETKKFNVFTQIPAHSKEQCEKIRILIQEELKKYGKVETPEIDTGQCIDLSSISGGTFMTYTIENIYDPTGEKLKIIRATLHVDERVTVDKTQQKISAYIWTSNCFLPGDTKHHLEKLIQASLQSLLEDFSRCYKSVNSEEPFFNYPK